MNRKLALLVFIVLSAQVQTAIAFQADSVTTFVSPDSSYEAFSEFMDSVDATLYLSVYELSSPAVGEGILKLLNEGKGVVIMVDDSPAGGLPDDELGLLTIFMNAGAEVRYSGDELRFYHGKYGVADNETLFITSENLGRSGFPLRGAKGNRGWGTIIDDPGVARYFAELFYRDLSSSEPFKASPRDVNLTMPGGNYDAGFRLQGYAGSFDVIPVVAPENAVDEIIRLIDSANKTLYIEQFYIYKYWGKRKTGSVEETPNLFLEAAIDASRRGVQVRMLLDDTWYNTERDDPVSNPNTLLYVNDVARKEGLDLEARLVDSEALGIEKLHNKGVVADGNAVLISSVNWNENSPRNNRETGVIIVGEPAGYFEEVFLHDWGDEEKGRDYRLFMALVLTISAVIVIRWRVKRGRA